MALNKWIGIGRLTKNPELEATPNGIPVCRFSVAVDREYRKDREKETDFITVVAWRGSAEFVCKHFEKGSPIQIEGKIQTGQYTDKEGNKRYTVEVVADSVGFVEGASRIKPQEERPSGGEYNPFEGFTELADDEVEGLPF